MPHYARLMSGADGEKLRHLLMRRLTARIVNESPCVVPPHKAGCVYRAISQMWRDP